MGNCFLIPVLALLAGDPLDRAITKIMKDEHIPGAAIAVVSHGKIVRQGAYGVANLEHGTPVTVDTRFEIASMSKMFTATAIRMLIDEGKVDLEDPLSKFFDRLPPAWKAMRIKHLIGMSAGFPEDWEVIGWRDVREEYDDTSMLAEFGKLKLLSPPGAAFHYSSPAYAMLGMIITKLTGQPFARFIETRIFAPAGMTQTTYNDSAAVVQGRADGYRRLEGGKMARGFYVAPYMHARADVGILTTARDLAKWAIALESGRILSHPERLFVPFTGNDGRDLGYAYGWFTGFGGGHRMAMHNGGFRTGFRSGILYFPDDALTIALVTNCTGCGGSLSRPIAAHYLKDFIDVPQAARVDDKPDDSAKLIAALRSLGSGKMDAAVFAVDAVPDPSYAADALKNAEFSVVARHDLRSRKLRARGRELAELVLVKVAMKQPFHLGLYRDGDGKVQFVELIE